jgi:hypothetical protein
MVSDLAVEGWPPLTSNNCFFIVMHSHPLGQFVRGLKRTESRPRKVHRPIVVLVSAMADSASLSWDSDPTIRPNTIYCVGWVSKVTEGTGASYAKYDWHIDPLVVLQHPIDLKGVPVGRNGGGHVSPREEHAIAMHGLNAALRALRVGMSGKGKSAPRHPGSTSTWEVFADGAPVINSAGESVDTRFVVKFTEVCVCVCVMCV